jgi:hypothetical protein
MKSGQSIMAGALGKGNRNFRDCQKKMSIGSTEIKVVETLTAAQHSSV